MTIELDFCALKFFDNYVICEVFEGETLSTKESEIQTEIIIDYYKDKPFGYISHRIHSYAVNPSVYLKSCNTNGFLGFAIVSNNRLALQNAEIEKQFCNKKLKTYTKLEDAIDWFNLASKTCLN